MVMDSLSSDGPFTVLRCQPVRGYALTGGNWGWIGGGVAQLTW
jgi:hypothetical protein